MMDELKPVQCGCGGEAVIYVTHWWGKCYVCECEECGTASRPCDTEAEAITAWNRAMGAKDINVPNKERTAKVSNQIFNNSNPYTVGAWIGTCECGELVSNSSKYCHMCGAKLDWSGNEQSGGIPRNR